MNIKIYTYSDPYKLTSEAYWDEIKNCPYFCASQTLVNGMNTVYSEQFKKNQLATVSNLVNALYSDWEKINTKMKQLMEVDAEINNLEEDDKVKRALSYSMKDISKSIRLLKELDIDPENIDPSFLSVDQEYVYRIYKSVCSRENSNFEFSRADELDVIDEAIKYVLTRNEVPVDHSIETDAIVIFGVFQFNPAILDAIEDISRFKKVILLFNYQPQYRELYAPWIRIYQEFEKKIDDRSNNTTMPSPMFVNSYPMNKLADCIGKMYNGEPAELDNSIDELEVIEFENITQFAGYIAMIFDKALIAKKQSGTERSNISYMSESFYSTSSDINNLLRSYFPEQFGERHFLDYPVGHFFVSVVSMWDSETSSVKFENMSFIRDCLVSGLLKEEKHGQHINTFNQIASFVDNENTLDGLISRLDVLKKCLRGSSEERRRIEYFQVDKEDLMALKEALIELNDIIKGFFEGFDKGGDNFRRFYKKVVDFIKSEIQNNDRFDAEMQDVVERLLNKLETSDLPDTGTLVCLKETMSYYLSQEENVSNAANWIVHDFEQIDGEIIASKIKKDDDICYHFCQLSDTGMCSAKKDAFPWPLNLNFFSKACEIFDWKYIVFLKSKREQKFFRRYALVFGLEFLRNVKGKLSYVKDVDGKENDLYFMLRMLNVKVKKYDGLFPDAKAPLITFDVKEHSELDYSRIDEARWNICKYRFSVESLIQNRTIYRNKYLIQQYLSVLLENSVLREIQGSLCSSSELKEKILECYKKLDTSFKISNEYEKTALIYNVMNNVSRDLKKKKVLKADEESMMFKEDMLYTDLKKTVNNSSVSEIKKILRETERFDYSLSENCRWCSCRDVCLQYNFDD